MSNSNYNTRLTASTLEKLEGKIRAQILDRKRALSVFKREGMDEVQGGTKLVYSLVKDDNTTFQSYADDDEIVLARQDPLTAAEYEWAQYAGSIFLTGIEQFKNSASDVQIVSLLEGHIKQLEDTVSKTLNDDLFTAQTGKNINGMPDLIDAGSNGTVGNINSSTYSYWRNVHSTLPSNTFGTTANGDGMSTLSRKLREARKEGMGKYKAFTSSDILQYMENAMVANQRLTSRDNESGFAEIMYKGVPFMDDSSVATGNIFLPNLEHLRLVVGKGKNFKLSKQVEPSNQDASAWKYIVYLQLICKERRTQARISGITGA